jgi:hypothetical protein
MNKRIQELAEQARLLPKEIGPVVETRHMKNKQQDLEKFAELIIKECAKVADETQFKFRNYPVSIAIEDHFDLPK